MPRQHTGAASRPGPRSRNATDSRYPEPDRVPRITPHTGKRGNPSQGLRNGKLFFDEEKAAENQTKRTELQKSAVAEAEGVLTEEQRKRWKELTGPPFDTSKLFPQGGSNLGFTAPSPKGSQ